MSDDWLSGDPFADPDDPAARERAERRREREEKRQKKAGKTGKRGRKGGSAGGDSGDDLPSQQRGGSVESSPEPPSSEPLAGSASVQGSPSDADEPGAAATGEPGPATSEQPAALAPQTADQEFWDEEVAPERPDETDAQRAWNEPPEEAWQDEGLPPERTAGAAAGTAGARAGGGGGRDAASGGVLRALRRHPFRILAGVLALVLIWFLWSLFQPFHGDGSGKVAVTIPKGSSVSEVADLLDEKGVIDSSTFFQLRVTLEGKRSDLYAGHFTLAEGMSYGAAIGALSVPPPKRVSTVTVPEGYTRSQAAPLISEAGIEGDYMKATVRSKYLDPAQYGGKGAKDLEGFLFPDTFELKPNAPVEDLVQLQLEDFKRRIKGVDMRYAKSKNLTVFDVLIIASMVEDEAGLPGQRKQVASVIYNRLSDGMPLGIDATIRFATDNWTEPLTESELAIDSPYNTRTNTGLPPGPINSPGLAAIEAAAHPAKSDYLFYVNEPGTCGKLSFSKTEAEFFADVDRYNSAREAAGGNSPDSCEE